MTKRRESGNVVSYGPSAYVESALTQVCATLKAKNSLLGLDSEEYAKRLAHYYVDMDAIHPFWKGIAGPVDSLQVTWRLPRDTGLT